MRLETPVARRIAPALLLSARAEFSSAAADDAQHFSRRGRSDDAVLGAGECPRKSKQHVNWGSRHEDDGQRAPVFPSQGAKDVVSAHPRQVDVEDYQNGPILERCLEGILGSRCLVNLVSSLTKRNRRNATGAPVAVGDEYAAGRTQDETMVFIRALRRNGSRRPFRSASREPINERS